MSASPANQAKKAHMLSRLSKLSRQASEIIVPKQNPADLPSSRFKLQEERHEFDLTDDEISKLEVMPVVEPITIQTFAKIKLSKETENQERPLRDESETEELYRLAHERAANKYKSLKKKFPMGDRSASPDAKPRATDVGVKSKAQETMIKTAVQMKKETKGIDAQIVNMKRHLVLLEMARISVMTTASCGVNGARIGRETLAKFYAANNFPPAERLADRIPHIEPWPEVLAFQK
jgi:hypothetical protein